VSLKNAAMHRPSSPLVRLEWKLMTHGVMARSLGKVLGDTLHESPTRSRAPHASNIGEQSGVSIYPSK
jgi:hypothetical protein